MSDAVFSFLKPAALFSHIADFLLGIPLAMLLYSAAFTLSRREISRGETFQGENSQGQKSLREDPYRCGNARTELLSRRSCEKLRQEVKFLPLTMSAAVFLPPLLLYLLFFISQSEYYLSAFTGRLPEGFVFSRYAPGGIFQSLRRGGAERSAPALSLPVHEKAAERRPRASRADRRDPSVRRYTAAHRHCDGKDGNVYLGIRLSLRRLLASLAMAFSPSPSSR